MKMKYRLALFLIKYKVYVVFVLTFLGYINILEAVSYLDRDWFLWVLQVNNSQAIRVTWQELSTFIDGALQILAPATRGFNLNATYTRYGITPADYNNFLNTWNSLNGFNINMGSLSKQQAHDMIHLFDNFLPLLLTPLRAHNNPIV